MRSPLSLLIDIRRQMAGRWSLILAQKWSFKFIQPLVFLCCRSSLKKSVMNMGHFMTSTFWTTQRQSHLGSPGGNVVLTSSIPFSILQKRPLIFWAVNKRSLSLRLPEHHKKVSVNLGKLQRCQKLLMFFSVAGVLISFDTPCVFVVVVGESVSSALWEVHPKKGKTRKVWSLQDAQTALAPLTSGRRRDRFIKL